MEFVNSNNFRIRGNMIPNLNIEEFIKSIGNQYDIDMTAPKWKHAITRLQDTVIDCRHRIKDHNLRNSLILERLQKEFTYISPFYLTDIMARTARKWERLKTLHVSTFDPILLESIGSISSGSINPEMKEEEISEMTIDDDGDMKEEVETFLPPLNTMSFKTINCKLSPIASEIYNKVTKDISFLSQTMTAEKANDENVPHRLLITSVIKHSPKIIEIDSSQVYTTELKLKNCANRIALIQYHSLIEISKLKSVSVLPATTVKLSPGITYTFKLIFKLVKVHNFASKIKFHVKYPANSMTSSNSDYEYYVPIISLQDKKIKYRSVTAPEMIVLPPIYSWEVKNKSKFYEYPFVSSAVRVNTKDNHSYYVRIVKREVNNVCDETDETNTSNEVNVTTPTSVAQNIDNDIKDTFLPKVSEISSVPHKGREKSNSVTSQKSTLSKKSVINTTTTSNPNILDEVLQLIVKTVERAMDVFVFDKTYLFLKSGETKCVRVYFTQVHNIGCHNCYYDFKFYDSECNELIFTKTTKVFADVMPHPIQITPDALDMTDTPIIFGYCVNSFVITNTHCRYPVNIRIVTSAKMKKLIKIEPMETMILPKKCAKFAVTLCTHNKTLLSKKSHEDNLFVLLTFKILISGYTSAYKNITPIYYDIIAPGVHQYEKVYLNMHSGIIPLP